MTDALFVFERACSAAHPRMPTRLRAEAENAAIDALPQAFDDAITTSSTRQVLAHISASGSARIAAAATPILHAHPLPACQSFMDWDGPAGAQAGAFLLASVALHTADLSRDNPAVCALLNTLLNQTGAPFPDPVQQALHSICLCPDDVWAPDLACAHPLALRRLSPFYGMNQPAAARAMDARLRALIPDSAWIHAAIQTQDRVTTTNNGRDPLGALAALYAAAGPQVFMKAIKAIEHGPCATITHHDLLRTMRQLPAPESWAHLHRDEGAARLRPLLFPQPA